MRCLVCAHAAGQYLLCGGDTGCGGPGLGDGGGEHRGDQQRGQGLPAPAAQRAARAPRAAFGGAAA